MLTAQVQSFSLQPGAVVSDRYLILEFIGLGSMAMLYRCQDLELSNRIIAMKVLLPRVASDRSLVARFRHEVISSYVVNHPNVVRTFDYLHDGDLVALTMEYIGGGSLAELLHVRTHITIDDIVDKFLQMCQGVEAIHQAGIVHRDLKPENILLTEDGAVKIADFSIAWNGGGTKLTRHGGVLGTLAYASPEYLETGELDKRGDIYALGVLLYQVLTGVIPLQGATLLDTIMQRVTNDPPAPHLLRPDCPCELSRIALRAMDRRLETRYQTVGEMLDDLRAFRAWTRKSSRPLRRDQEVRIIVRAPQAKPDAQDARSDERANTSLQVSRPAHDPVLAKNAPLSRQRALIPVVSKEPAKRGTVKLIRKRRQTSSSLAMSSATLISAALLLSLLTIAAPSPSLAPPLTSSPAFFSQAPLAAQMLTEDPTSQEYEFTKPLQAVALVAAEMPGIILPSVNALSRPVAPLASPMDRLNPPLSAPRESDKTPNIQIAMARQDASSHDRGRLIQTTAQQATKDLPSKPDSQNTRPQPLAVETKPEDFSPPRSPEPALEYRIKANLLYKFADFVEWPVKSDKAVASTMNICLIGSDPFGNYLNNVTAGKSTARRKQIVLRRFTTPENISAMKDCHIAFLREETALSQKVIDSLQNAGVVTVSDQKGAAMINFFISKGRVRFSIDSALTKRAGLLVDSRLMRLADLG